MGARKSSTKGQVGRPKTVDSQNLLAQIYVWIQKRKNESTKRITHEEVEKEFGLSPVRARSILSDLAQLTLMLKPDPEGITLVNDTCSYYWSQMSVNSELKEAVAAKTAALLPRYTTVACSPGTTVARVIRRIMETSNYVSIITNSMGAMDLIFQYPSTLEFTGGTYNAATHSCLGDRARSSFKEAHCSRAVVGVSGVDKDGNLFVKHREEVQVLEQIVASATDEIFVVATIDKLAQGDMWRFGSIEKFLKQGPGRPVRLVTNPLEQFPQSIAERKPLAERVFAALREHIEVAAGESKEQPEGEP